MFSREWVLSPQGIDNLPILNKEGKMKKILALAALIFASASYAQSPPFTVDERGVFRSAHVFHIMFLSEVQARETSAMLRAVPTAKAFAAFKAAAVEKSQDPGSSASGGDLGVIQEGQMDKGFEEGVFAQRVKTVSTPVKSQFGWHVIYVESAKTTPVSSICAQGLQKLTPSSPLESAALKLTKASDSTTDLREALPGILGPGAWSAPLKDGEGNLSFFKADPIDGKPGNFQATLHIEYPLARLNLAPLACKRSVRVMFSVDCKARTVAYDGFREFELRGGMGRVINLSNLRGKENSNIDSGGGLQKQIQSMACART